MSSVAEAEERYLALVEHAGEGVVVMVDDRFVFANRRAEEILRLPRERILAEGIMHLLHPEDNELVSERRRRRFAGEDVPSRYQVRLVDPDGSVRWMEMGVALVPWSGQVGTMTFFSDITERKAMVDALHRSEERYRAVVEHSGDGLVVVQNERFVFVNRRAEAIVRLPREEMMRHGFLHSIHPDDRALVLERQRRRLAGEQVPDRYELRLLLEGGDIIWIEIGVTLVPWDGQMARRTCPPAGEYFSALDSRLPSAWRSSSGSNTPDTRCGSTSTEIAHGLPGWAARASCTSVRHSDSRSTSRGRHCSICASARPISSTRSIIIVMRRTAPSTLCSTSARSCAPMRSP